MKKSAALLLSFLLVLGFFVFLLFFLSPGSEGTVIRAERTWEPEDARIDLNKASAEELQEISGIGPVLSEAIVAWREENGPFLQAEDLLQVPGIGEKTVDAIKDELVIGGIDENTGRG